MAGQLRPLSEVYDAPAMEWSLRAVGPHLHPGSEETTVDLAKIGARFGLGSGQLVLDVASALGAPGRFLARRFGARVVGLDLDPVMHAGARAAARVEAMDLVCFQVRGRTERMPFRDASFDAAWSQDALCHMEQRLVFPEVARVLRPGAPFVFSDWVARPGLSRDDRLALKREWGFPTLHSIAGYVALLTRTGFEVLLAEDVTDIHLARSSGPNPDLEAWTARHRERWGAGAADRLAVPGAWRTIVGEGRAGYARFAARRLTVQA